MKKKICFLLAAAIAATSSITTYGANFSDLGNVPWDGAVPYINKAADRGLMVGSTVNGQKVFRAKESVTLCETAQLVYSLLKETGNLKDTSGLEEKWMSVMKGYGIPQWAYTGVSYCLENSIIAAGDVVAFMSGNSSVGAKREQVAYMFGRALQTVDGSLNGGTAQSFKDSSKITAAAVPYVNLLYQKGVITGDANGNFNPGQKINRAEMAVLISNAYDVLENVNVQRQAPIEDTGTYSLADYSTPVGAKICTVYEVQDNGENIVLVVNDTDGTRQGYVGAYNMTIYYSFGGSGTLSEVKAGDTVNFTYDNSRLVRLEVNGSRPIVEDEVRKTSGSIAQVTPRKIRLSGGNYYDIDKDVVVRLDGRTNKDLDDIIEAVDDGDDIYANLSLNSEEVVTKIVARTEDDDDDDDDSDETKDGIISRITSNIIKLRSKEYDLADEKDLDVSVSDGSNSKIKDLDDLITAVNEDDKEVDVTIDIDDDEVTSIRGEVTGVEGELDSVNVNGDKIKIKCDSSDKYTYECDGDVDITVDNETVKDLDKLYDMARKDTITVEITLDDDIVTKIVGKIK